jgi:hypothetical protein
MLRLALLVMVLAGCGPIDGTTCETADSRRCDGTTKVAYCEAGKWKSYDCPSGCSGEGECAWRGVVEGASCPTLRAQPPCVADGESITCGTGTWQKTACPLCKKDKTLEESGAPCSGGICRCQ